VSLKNPPVSSLKVPRTCAIAESVRILGDKWSLLILRDVILYKKCRFKEFKSSKEKIATNILASRLKFLVTEGLLRKLDPTGTKKSTRYIATSEGLLVLPIMMEMYMFSIKSIDESTLDAVQMTTKEEFISNRSVFEEKVKATYLNFVSELSELILSPKE
jgi:DNA-binding HxlR family transcriptional regulator